VSKYTLRITLAVVLVLVFLSGSLSDTLDAMSWPSEDAVLIRNFGFNDRGSPVLGMVFNGGTEVLASEKGEVIFSRNGDDASRLPSPFGAWTAVDHGDGLISIYSRYAGETISVTQFEKLQPIASTGASGWSVQDGFYFIIFDRRERRWINPAMIITPVQRTNPPQILSVVFRNDQGVSEQSRNLTQGRYTIVVNAVSPSTNTVQRNFLAPQRIYCSVNGAEAGSLNFESFSAKDGVLMVYRNGLVPARQVYSAPGAFEAAEVFLTRSQANVEIIVQDLSGNSSNAVYRLTIN
jgi:hypothetical protein